jgi:hypothetical protein
LGKAVKKYPWQVSNILRANAILPLFLINFGSGLIEIGFLEYLTPALGWGIFYSSFVVYCGS